MGIVLEMSCFSGGLTHVVGVGYDERGCVVGCRALAVIIPEYGYGTERHGMKSGHSDGSLSIIHVASLHLDDVVNCKGKFGDQWKEVRCRTIGLPAKLGNFRGWWKGEGDGGEVEFCCVQEPGGCAMHSVGSLVFLIGSCSSSPQYLNYCCVHPVVKAKWAVEPTRMSTRTFKNQNSWKSSNSGETHVVMRVYAAG